METRPSVFHAPNSLIKLSTKHKFSERHPQRSKNLHGIMVFPKAGIVAVLSPQIERGCTTLSYTPHHLLLPICRQHPLTHNFEVSKINKVLSSAPCSRNHTTANKITVSFSKLSLKPGKQKNPWSLLYGRSHGGSDWIVRPEWQEHCP